MSWTLETLNGIMSTAEGGVYNVISKETVEALLSDKGALKLLAEHGYEITPLTNDAGEVIGHVIRTASSSNGATTAVSNTVNVLVKDATVDQTMIDSIASGSIGTASDVGELAVGDTVSQVTMEAGGSAVGGTALSSVAGPAIAVGLGVGAGVVAYKIAPDFWNRVAATLVDKGKTIGGQVISFFDKQGNTYYDKDTVEEVRKALIEDGYLLEEGSPGKAELKDPNFDITELTQPIIMTNTASWYSTYLGFGWRADCPSGAKMSGWLDSRYNPSTSNETIAEIIAASEKPFKLVLQKINQKGEIIDTNYETADATAYIINGNRFYLSYYDRWGYSNSLQPVGMYNQYNKNSTTDTPIKVGYIMLYGDIKDAQSKPNPLPEDGAIDTPTGNPTTDGDNKEKRRVYPYNYPSSLPNPNNYDDPSQDPTDLYNPDPTPGDKDRSNPKKDTNPQPEDEPQDEPAPNPDPNKPSSDPTDVKPQDPDDPNPPDPDGGKTPDPPFPIVPSAGLGNIYNPTRAQVEALQSYLWSSTNLVDIMKIFQNPVEGIISLHWVFGTPIQGGSKEITLGYLPTGVSAPTVANQFIDIDCGTILIPLKQKNALDYPPYTDIQIYLPFIGIQPLNAYDLVGGTLNVKYRIDAYTGACVAKLTATRGGLSAKLYEFAGNCGYELPLTSGNFIGMVGNVVSGAVMGALTGGVSGAVLGATGSAIHSNLNISRSGNLSANAGICGSRNPYIIITRAVPYDAANYNQFYGYPSNKTVYLSNCKGFTKVKEIILHTSATQAEKEEIEALLKEGVYL